MHPRAGPVHTAGVYFTGLYAGYSLSLGAGTFLDDRLGWKWAYVLAALGGMAVAALAFLTVAEPEQQKVVLHRLDSAGSVAPTAAAVVCASTTVAAEIGSEWSPARDAGRRAGSSLLGRREGSATSPSGREATAENGDAAGDGPHRVGLLVEGAYEKPRERRGGGDVGREREWRRTTSSDSSGETT